MIVEDYCTYEVVQLLKEKGAFNELDLRWKCGDDGLTKIYQITHQMAMKWLRSKGIIITPIESDVKNAKGDFLWTYEVNGEYMYDYWDYYYDAVDSALKYCLTNLL